jgi:hypothetical protein
MISMGILALHELHRSGPIEPPMQVVRLCEEFDVCGRVEHGESVATVLRADGHPLPVQGNVAEELGTGKVSHFPDVALHDLFLSPPQRQVLEPNESGAHPLRPFPFLERLKADGQRPVEEHAKIADGVEEGIVELHDHRGKRMGPPGRKVSSCVGKEWAV